jgi:aminoglycoside 3-N-acetyltransferase I
MKAIPIVAGVSMVPLGERDQLRLAELCRRCSDFFELVEGQPGGPATAAEILGPLPDHVTSGTMQVFGIERRDDLIGVVELLEGYPGANDWYVGDFVLSPEVRGVGLGTNVWVGLREWIREREAVVVRLVVQKQNPSARIFWERQGFTVEKEVVAKAGRLESPAWRMLLSLRPSADPNVGSGERIVTTESPKMRSIRLKTGDRELARALFSLMAEVFEEECEVLSDAYIDRLLAREDFWAIAAFDGDRDDLGDRIVGGITAHTLPMTRTEISEVFIYDVAVRRDHQRKGVGRHLVGELRELAAAAGIRELFVPADNDDVHALDFYRALGGTAAPVTFFTFARRDK